MLDFNAYIPWDLLFVITGLFILGVGSGIGIGYWIWA